MAKKRKTIKKSRKEKKPEVLDKNQIVQERQVFWTLAIIGIILLGFLGGYYYFYRQNNFDFAGVRWNREKVETINFYHSNFRVFYNSNATYNLYLRENPKENNIPVDIEEHDFWTQMIVTLSPEADKCRDSGIAALTFGMFLKGAIDPRVTIEGAYSDEEYAISKNQSYATCEDAIGKTVVLIRESDAPGIVKEGDCYIINIGSECEVNKAVERLIVAMLQEISDNRQI